MGDTVQYEGRFLRLVDRGGWEFAQRRKASGVVGIIAVTGEGRLVLVQQHRPALGCEVIELPAGLAGDTAEHSGEALATAARRELLEETGYECASMEAVADGVSSAGLTDEVITLFVARGLRRVGPGGGDGSESITVHEVSLGEVVEFLAGRRGAGMQVDLKVYAALGLVEEVAR